MISLVVEKGFLLWLQSSSINSAIRQDYFDFLEGLNSNLEIYIDFKQDSIDPIESSFIKLISNYNNPIVKQFKSIEEILEKDCTDKMPIYSMFFLTNESAKKVGELVNRGIRPI